MDPLTAGLGALGAGFNFFGGLIYSDEERARDAAANNNAEANKALAGASLANAQTNKQIAAAQIAANEKLGMLALAGVGLLVGGWIISKAVA